MNQVSCHKSLIRNVSSLAKHLRAPSDPLTICDKIPALAFFFLPQPLTSPEVAQSARYCNKSLICSVSSLTKHWSSTSAHRIQ